MVLYFIVLAVFGIIMGIAPEIVADNVEICAENDLAKRKKQREGLNFGCISSAWPSTCRWLCLVSR